MPGLFIIISSILYFTSFNYQSIFSRNYNEAKLFMSTHADLFIEYSNAYQTDLDIIMPILFPEAIRYSIVSDYLQTKSLELVYVNTGEVDFSIGYFQMKPSFVNDLEEVIKKHPVQLAKYDSLKINGKKDITEIRKTRIDRLKQIEYQVAYANCLYDVMKIMYPEVFSEDKAFQIKFISTAFNHGFLTGQEEILAYTSKAFFPLNGRNNTQKYVYNDISLYFYINDLPQIVDKKR